MTDKPPSGTKSSAMLNNNLLSSPPRAPPSRGKERRNPSITPRKFQRFFTPRSRVSSQPSAARRALRDLAGPALNRCQTPSSPLKPISEENAVNDEPVSYRGAKRRKVQHTPDRSQCPLPSPLASSPAFLQTPDARPGLRSPIRDLRSRQAQDAIFFDDTASEDEDDGLELPGEEKEVNIPVPLDRRGFEGQLVQRMAGCMSGPGGRAPARPMVDWRTETADFYSKPNDVHFCSSHEGSPRCIPFCTTGCNKNSLVAVGDEEGYVRLLDSSKEFSKVHLSFPVHGNAVIDLEFSEDDCLLATASGDQTGRVIDMMTQTPVSILGQHTASLKQVRFQPGRGASCVLATSGRDGSVQIWDLRCRGGPVQEVIIRPEAGLHHRITKPVSPGCVVNSIYDAHARPVKPATKGLSAGLGSSTAPGDVARTGEVPGRIGEVSVTALQFLPAGREHLLLTACEADASVKLWDIRANHASRHHKYSTPISFTAAPVSHASWRPFGISAMTLGGDGSRLYTLCKDNTVYAYSTAHLVMGHAPELAITPAGEEPPRRRHHHGTNQGLGPIYGFRHPMFHATSFYVKAKIRPAAHGREELLAVGSSDGCAVVFPTDERFIQDAWQHPNESYLVGEATAGLPAGGRRDASSRPTLTRTNSGTNLFARQADTTPIVQRGTPLVRGHDKEVGALTWTNEGRLITVGDDFLVRRWSEGRDEAADLRTGGETEGRRWGCGWADVGDGWDGDAGDW
ncbi:WD40-repeat-containing domain protein [Podospora aff. communis PSN243]|uniref:WD40-repeat-containing domain protein n=1 Tax=Podospora aff. communis PSN243 TaxID=3040156 RepID=A0AAV9GMC1_9PEZI|nr:WD40-repeat-containing domain protein [Podospora aff. communis PSN243]